MAPQQGLSTRQARVVLVLGGVAMMVLAILVLGYLRDQRVDQGTDTADAADGNPPAPTVTDGALFDDADQSLADDLRPDSPTWRGPAQWDRGQIVTDIDTALAEAESARAAGHLYQPIEQSALLRYAEILQADPAHAQAAEGLRRVAETLRQDIEALIEQHQLEQAAELFPLLSLAALDEAEINALADRLEALQAADELVAEAQADIAAGRLIEPRGNNALVRLWHARQLDPTSQSVMQSLQQVEAGLIEQAVKAADNMRFDQADNWLQWAQRVRGGSVAVNQGRAQVDDLRQDQINEEAYLARVAMSDARFEQAHLHIESAQALGADDAAITALRQDLALSRVYGNYFPGQRFRDALVNSDQFGPDMVVLPHGSFQMGAAADEEGARPFESPLHLVSFQRAISLAVSEVTVAQFRLFVEHSGYQTDAERAGFSFIYSEAVGRITRQRRVSWQDGFDGRPAEDGDPVLHVSWNDAVAYAEWLATQTQQPYRLPSEAEFEYGQRAGTTTRYWWGDGAPSEVVENLTGSGDQSRRRRRSWKRAFRGYQDDAWGPAPAASYRPNPFGLYDMAGNVEEWVADCWHDSYVRAPTDGSAWVNRGCARRVVRGGFWGGAPETARSAYRTSYVAEQRGSTISFRVARELLTPAPQLVSDG